MTVMGDSNDGNQSFLFLPTVLLSHKDVCLLQQAYTFCHYDHFLRDYLLDFLGEKNGRSRGKG